MYATALLTLKNAMLRLEDENELDESHIIAA